MQHGAILGPVDVRAGKHGVDRSRHVRLLRELYEQFARRSIDMVLRVVEKQVVGLEAKPLDALLIAPEEVFERSFAHVLAIMRLELLPGGQIGGIAGGEFSVSVGVRHADRS